MNKVILLIFLIPFSFISQSKLDNELQNLTKNEIVDSLINISYTTLIDNFYSSEKWINEALSFPNISPFQKAELLNKKSTISYYQGNYTLSTKEVLKAINIFDSLNLPTRTGALYAALGYQLKRLNLDEAQSYMLIGIKISEDLKDTLTLSASYNNYGVIKEFKNEIDSALYFYQQSLQITKNTKDSIGISYALNNIGGIYVLKNNYTRSIKYISDGLKIRQTLNDDHGIIESQNLIAEVFLHFNEIDSAIHYYNLSLSGSKRIKYTYLSQNNLEGLAKSYAISNDYELAFSCSQKAIQLKDSLRTISTNKEIALLKERFDSDKKDQEIAFKNDIIKKDSNLKTLLFTLIIVILILFISFYFWYKTKQKQKLQAEILIEKEKGIVGIINAQEEERKRIAKELHDGIVQELTSLKFNLKNELSDSENKSSEKIFKQLENSTTELRNISHQMMPTALTELGIVEALEDMLHKSLDALDINFNFESFGISNRLKENIEITIYRVSQELINNIVKHSGANEVNVQLFKSGQNIILIIEDNGKGISKDDKKDGIGLMNISSRLDTIHGKVNFEASPNSGTLATVKIPLND